MKYSISKEKPSDFNLKVEIAGCYLECNQKILLLKRHLSRPQGDTWGIAAGKLEPNESPLVAVVREVKEEIGVEINELDYLGKLYCRIPQMDYVFHVFHKYFHHVPKIILSLEEHSEARWVTIEEARKLPLIIGGFEALDFFLESKSS